MGLRCSDSYLILVGNGEMESKIRDNGFCEDLKGCYGKVGLDGKLDSADIRDIT